VTLVQTQPPAAGHATSPATGDEPAAIAANVVAPRRPRPAWHDAPLRVKACLLIALAAVAGCGVGILEARLGYRLWPMAIGLGLVMAVLFPAARAWLAGPFEQLIEKLAFLGRFDRPIGARGLPTHRRDEVGQLARGMKMLCERSVHEYNQARTLRKTLDDRITRATAEATHRLREIAMRDPLTDLGNRRFLDAHLEPLVQSCLASKTDLVCVAIDLDNFKAVNDAMGHAVGDKLLMVLAGLIGGSIRRDDVKIRLGGDEFLILMPGCSVRAAREVFRRVTELFRQHVHTTLPAEAHADASIGIVSLLDERVTTGNDLLARADARLYTAKQAGKGRIVAE
jgi:diguanylate cyclase (GGDEF)-like protein